MSLAVAGSWEAGGLASHLQYSGSQDWRRETGHNGGDTLAFGLDWLEKLDSHSEKLDSHPKKYDSYVEKYNSHKRRRREGDEGVMRGREEDEGVRQRAEGLLTEVHGGLNTLGTTIKIVTALLTIFGADSTRRDDEYEAAVDSLLGLGTAMLRMGGTNLVSSLSSSQPSSSSLSSKLGVAAPTTSVYSEVLLDKEVSDAEALHRKQVATIVAQLSQEQIAAQQVVVEKHVEGQAEKEGLSEVEALQLQIDTLQHNGLPLPDVLKNKILSAQSSSPSSSSTSSSSSLDALGGLYQSAQGIVSSIFSESPDNGVSHPPATGAVQHTKLPQKGTLQHTIMLNLFNAQQSVNMFLTNLFGPTLPSEQNQLKPGLVASDKIGQASDTEEAASGNGLMDLPNKLLRFVLPPQSAEGGSGPTGISASTAAIGLLTTGALGSVIYSYAANGPPDSLASSATSLAADAVAAIEKRRDDMFTAASSAFARVTGVEEKEGEGEGDGNYVYYYDEDAPTYSDYSDQSPGQQQYSGQYSDYGYTFGQTNENSQAFGNNPSSQNYGNSPASQNFGNSPSSQNYGNSAASQTFQSGEQQPSVIVYPDYDYQDSIPVVEEPVVPQGIQFYEPSPKVSMTDDAKPDEFNPWANSPWSGNTDHLYRRRRDVEDTEVWVQVPARLRICEEDFMDCREDRNRKACVIRNNLCRRK